MYSSSNLNHLGSEAHAFDTPFEVMKNLRRDFNELKAMFHAEQQQRAVEVQQLRQEVQTLREQLAKEKHERNTITHQTMQDLTQLKSDKLKGLEEMKVTFTNAISSVNSSLQDEIRDRQNSENLRDTRESAERSERQSETCALKDDLGRYKQAFFGSRDEMFGKINCITHDIEVIASAMAKVSAAKGKLSKESLQCFKYFDGSSALSTSGS